MTTDFLSDCHNYFICQKKQLCQVNQNNRTLFGPYYELPTNQVLDCQGLETVCSFITPGVITFPAQLSMSFKSSRKYGIRLNTTFYRFKRNYKSRLKITPRCKDSDGKIELQSETSLKQSLTSLKFQLKQSKVKKHLNGLVCSKLRLTSINAE